MQPERHAQHVLKVDVLIAQPYHLEHRRPLPYSK